ncbi:Putative ribonuclease H protein At1g65750 [Linum perenne]
MRGTYEYIIERMQSKLAGWKQNSLSLAGRLSLALSILNAIPSYAMQSSALPYSITSRIDSILRNFVWGASSDHRKPHLLSWDVLCRSKEQGGLGFHKARELNDAYLMKLGWTILKEPDRLWVQVITSKYLKETINGPQLRRKTGSSSLWKGIRRVWPDLASGCQQSIRNGKDTLFWTANWLDSGIILADHATRTLTDSDLACSVADMTENSEGWDWDRLSSSLPPAILNQIAGMGPPKADGGEDDLIWGPEPKGHFSLKSAYDIRAAVCNPSQSNIWRIVWKWQGPSRIKHFLWLVTHDRLLTNAERHRRHISDTDSCRLYNNVSESALHIFRDCHFARSVWHALLPSGIVHDFFTGDIQRWISKGLQMENFNLIFGITIWILWKARNEDIFDNRSVTSDQLRLRVLH